MEEETTIEILKMATQLTLETLNRGKPTAEMLDVGKKASTAHLLATHVTILHEQYQLLQSKAAESEK